MRVSKSKVGIENRNCKRMEEFFKDLKVIELASVLAGPAAGMFFAELGAKVIKVENKNSGGDVTRSWRLPDEPGAGPSAYYAAPNYRKEPLMLNLLEPEARAQLAELIKDADLVLSNYVEKTARKLSVHWEDLRKLNPGLIFIQLDGFAASDRPAYDVVLQAETGWISMTGAAESQPAKLPVALIDIIAGHQLKEAALLGIIHQMRTGKGSLWRCNLEQASLSALANQATNYLMNGKVAKPSGTTHPNIAPYGDWFTSADKIRFVLAVGSDAQFEKLCEVLSCRGLSSDPRYITNTMRVANRTSLCAALQAAISSFPFATLTKNFEVQNIPFGEIKTLDKVLQSEAAEEMLRTENIEGRDTKRISGNAFTFESF